MVSLDQRWCRAKVVTEKVNYVGSADYEHDALMTERRRRCRLARHQVQASRSWLLNKTRRESDEGFRSGDCDCQNGLTGESNESSNRKSRATSATGAACGEGELDH